MSGAVSAEQMLVDPALTGTSGKPGPAHGVSPATRTTGLEEVWHPDASLRKADLGVDLGQLKI